MLYAPRHVRSDIRRRHASMRIHLDYLHQLGKGHARGRVMHTEEGRTFTRKRGWTAGVSWRWRTLKARRYTKVDPFSILFSVLSSSSRLMHLLSLCATPFFFVSSFAYPRQQPSHLLHDRKGEGGWGKWRKREARGLVGCVRYTHWQRIDGLWESIRRAGCRMQCLG